MSAIRRALPFLSPPLLLCLAAAPAAAGSVRGTVVLPASPEAGADAKSPPPLSYWRVENGVLPIAPPPGEPRDGVILVLEVDGPPVKPPPKGPKDSDPNAEDPKPVPLTALPSRLSPRVLPLPVGLAIEVRNEDRRPRTLYLRDGESFMPRQPLAPGATRGLKLSVPGDYSIVDADTPRLVTTVVVVATPYVATSDDKGAFSIEAPDGKYRLKAWHRGAWTEPEPVEIGGRHPAEVQVKLPPPAARTARAPAPTDKGGAPPAPTGDAAKEAK